MGRKVLPNTLFRFSKPDSPHFLKEFSLKEVHFSNPTEFNDPFDCQIEYRRVLEEAIANSPLAEGTSLDNVISKVSAIIGTLGICCFSRAKKNQLMWAHYAGSHRGICIGFNEDILCKETGSKVADVIYGNKHPVKSLDWQFALISEDKPLDEVLISNWVFKSLVVSKYSYWRYERERRLLKKGIGSFQISADAICSVTIGLKITPETKLQLYSTLNSPEWRHVRLFKSVPKNEAYALDFEPIHLSELLKDD